MHFDPEISFTFQCILTLKYFYMKMQFLYGVWSHYLLQTWWPDQPPLQDILQGLQQCRSSSDVPRNLTHILNTQEPDTHGEHTIQLFWGFWQPTFLYWPITTVRGLKSFNLEVKLVKSTSHPDSKIWKSQLTCFSLTSMGNLCPGSKALPVTSEKTSSSCL